MGAFADLETDATYFGPHQTYMTSIADDYGAASAVEVLKSEAKAILKIDLQEKLGLLPSDSEDMATLDTITTAQSERMKRILAMKQLELVFEDKNNGEGSTTYTWWRQYAREYGNAKAGFAGLVRKQGTVTVRSIGMHR